MNPLTEGSEEKGPSGVPYVNDPAKHSDPASIDDEIEFDPSDPDIAGNDGSDEPE